MGGFRVVFGLLLFGCLLLFSLGLLLREPRWTRLGMVLLKWTVLAALGFFAVVLAQRLLEH